MLLGLEHNGAQIAGPGHSVAADGELVRQMPAERVAVLCLVKKALGAGEAAPSRATYSRVQAALRPPLHLPVTPKAEVPHLEDGEEKWDLLGKVHRIGLQTRD